MAAGAETPDPSLPATGESTPIEQPADTDRHSALAALDRFLVRGSVIRGTAVLTVIAVLAALVCTIGVEYLLYGRMDPEDLIVASLVTMLVAAPICAYAQSLIRKIRASRRALKDLTEHLAVALQRAEDANHAKSQFLANMSHELRTPLNAIIGFSEMMRSQLLGPIGNPRYLDYAKDIHNSGSHLLNIINDILDLARVEAGEAAQQETEECDMDALVDGMLRMLRPIAAKQRVTVTREAGCEAPQLLVAERMTRQVLINIISNAVKFTPEGGTVVIGHRMTAGGDYALSVADSGVGMSPAEIVVALTPFGQNKNPLNSSNKGTGLGLPLAKAMMELQGGALDIDSTPGRGTTVTLIFPAERVVQPCIALSA